ncbi:hypothetical protein [Halococcoides cellulosivorans]|uniref:Uncharacterized protein n=1 Tax=Halococcoides cellulosivorans TaxID=1679096 RepID=A0A2R4X0M8_9EURY|nr:hypothetical protein [Halococcoides cellulosivorans]AWB27347.1 hypothetical protein HARCEL1_06350 [Halococcoides cellulosivorans]
MAIGTRGLLVGAYLGSAGIVVLHQGSALLEAVVSRTTPLADALGLIGAALVLAIGVALVAAAIALYSEHRWARPIGVVAAAAFAALSAGALAVLVDPILWVAALCSLAPTALSGAFLARYEPTPDPHRRSRLESPVDTSDGH